MNVTDSIGVPPRVRVKFCGITRREDADLAASLGADAIGLVFHAASPRAVTITAARAIVERLPPFIAKVGLFVDAPERQIRAVLEDVPLDVLQFHGDEHAQDCLRYGKPYIKAIRMREGVDLDALVREHEYASALLLDAYVEGVAGGTGQRFDWDRVPSSVSKPIILAGGLSPDNVRAAIAQVRPYAVDVSGGVELGRGIKDPEKMCAFMKGVVDAWYF
jgi:phosphoribosylanthranilate isomerase